MNIVIDNNILFSIMKPSSINSYIFSAINAKFFAPEFILEELNEHREECLLKSGLSAQEFEMRLNEIEENIKFLGSPLYEDFLEKVSDLIEDADDIDFLALALYTHSAIWSNDSHFREQGDIDVFTTLDLLNMFLRREV
ncbi:MAG: PIN domain-containing protein [Nanoarchaeota archaeon]